MQSLKIFCFGLFLTVHAYACVHREYVHGEHCREGVWIEAHRGPRGRWHEGHWRCPRVVEEVEIE